MIIQRDEIDSFIPRKPKFIILGTMCALNARTIKATYQEYLIQMVKREDIDPH